MSHRKRNWVLFAVLVALLAAGLFWIVWTNTHFVTTYFTIENPKIPEAFAGFRIAQVSDLHNHKWGTKLTDQLAKEDPDIIVVTGDLVDSSHTDFEIAMDFLEKAMNIAPVYYVTGNHEAWLSDYNILARQMEEAGVHMMDDSSVLLTKGDASVNLIGIMDPDFVERDTSVQQAVVETKLQPMLKEEMYNIVLCHRPEVFAAYAELEADLVFTGHAHGGQIRIPFVGGLIAPNQGFFPKYTEGVYHQGQTDMVVSRGLGNSILPIRINNSPELVVVTLESEAS